MADLKLKPKQKILEVARQYGYREYIGTPNDKIASKPNMLSNPR